MSLEEKENRSGYGLTYSSPFNPKALILLELLAGLLAFHLLTPSHPDSYRGSGLRAQHQVK